MNGRITKFFIGMLALALNFQVYAQEPTKIPRIGYLYVAVRSTSPARVEAFRQGLREFGYVEGKNIVIEYRFANGKRDLLPALAADLVRLGVDVIVTGGPAATRPAKEATSTIPIVMAADSDPVGNGFVASLDRPAGNITGLSGLSAETSGKRLEILKESFPRLSRVAVLGNSTEPGHARSLRDTELAARRLGVQIQYREVADSNSISAAFEAVSKRHADAILILPGTVFNFSRKQIIDLALKSRRPAMYYSPEWAEDGGLMSYGVNIDELFRRAAYYVDRILKGAKPANMPVEQPRKFELVINLNTARQIGLTIPPDVLALTHKVIK